ncbi:MULTISPECIES: cytochrome b/b6 domain-containing protein [Sphingomonadales]|uniref:Cytochrome b/b6 domain-containing protein n=1 Tax=Sphingobium agri TaxID=2933566 RepID=A0ABT0DZY4_9SPHN|nr:MULTISPECIES: cytochrome b/b6 domain-containing protein [Sphingomonadaceae]MCK0532691.1 cytochrome b/b6 domain-containing protein [Sphingobium agri]
MVKADASSGAVRLRIWDLPTRLFHWTLVPLLAFAWWTAEERMLDWHRLAGYSIFTLLLFRIIWGVAGSSTARFANFVGGPSRLFHYIRGHMFNRSAAPAPGHNPVGGWSVIAMIAILAVQVGLGFFSVDIDGMESGPFSYLVDFETGRVAAEWHAFIFNIILALTALHVVAILFYLLHRRDNLVGPMISGRRKWTGDHPTLHFASSWTALVLFLLVAGGTWWLIAQFGRA